MHPLILAGPSTATWLCGEWLDGMGGWLGGWVGGGWPGMATKVGL